MDDTDVPGGRDDGHSVLPRRNIAAIAAIGRLKAMMRRMEAAPRSTADLTALAPELVCGLGFDGGLFSRVADGGWQPQAMPAVGRPRSTADSAASAESAVLPFATGTAEEILVRTGQPVLVPADHAQPRNGLGSIPGWSWVRAYVAVPIICGDRVVAMLHAGRGGAGAEVDDLDRELLAVLADGMALALTRAAATEHLSLADHLLAEFSAVLGTARAGLYQGLFPKHGDRNGGRGGAMSPAGPRAGIALPDSLTPREREVLAMVARGRTNRAIAAALHISDGTVKQHVKHILRKLEAANRSEAVVRWFEAGSADSPG